MLAELVDHVISIDPDQDWITAAVIDAITTGVVAKQKFSADAAGHDDAISWAEEFTVAGERRRGEVYCRVRSARASGTRHGGIEGERSSERPYPGRDGECGRSRWLRLVLFDRLDDLLGCPHDHAGDYPRGDGVS
jgi:hypothetical protein